jgi:hypothetical protein
VITIDVAPTEPVQKALSRRSQRIRRHAMALPSCAHCTPHDRANLKRATLRTFLAELGPVTEKYREAATWLLSARIERGDQRAAGLLEPLGLAYSPLGDTGGPVAAYMTEEGELIPWQE